MSESAVTPCPHRAIAARVLRAGIVLLALTGCGLQAQPPTSYGRGLAKPPVRLEGIGGPQRPDAARRAPANEQRRAVALPSAQAFPSPGHLGFSWPIGNAARVTSDFGWRRDPFSGGRRFHHGLDIACWPGESVRAADGGTVLWAGRAQIYGNTVVVAHRYGVLTLYAHLRAISVELGESVPASAVIGSCGSTGRSTGPHLHLEVRHGSSVYDPASFMP